MRWTEGKIERLGKLYKSGLEYAETGQRMGVTKYAVKAALKRHGIFEQYGRRKVIKRPKKKSAPKPEKQYNPNPITDTTRGWSYVPHISVKSRSNGLLKIWTGLWIR